MAAKSPVALIIGAGPNIGQSVIRKFASQGYKVGVAARSVKEADSTDSQLNIPSDFTKTEDVVNAFDRVKKAFGIPSVVVYNGKFLPLRGRRQPTNTSQSAKVPSHHPMTPSPSLSKTSPATRMSTSTVPLSPRNKPSQVSLNFRNRLHVLSSILAMSSTSPSFRDSWSRELGSRALRT